MIRNHLKIAFRNFGRYNVFSLINVIGLAIGLASSLMILLWVQDELSYDKFHDNSESIYRLGFTGVFGNNELNTVNTAAPTAEVLVNEYEEILDATRLLKGWSKQVSYKEKSFTEDRFMFADSNFFELFSYKLLYGDPHEVLNDTNTVVLTKSTALKYFGEENPIGKKIYSDSGRDFIVTGICEDVPANSHIDFDFLGSLKTLEWSRNDNWLTLSFLTYFVLSPECTIDDINLILNEVSKNYISPQLEEYLNIDMKDFAESGQTFEFHIQPLEDIHLTSNLDGELKPGGNKVYVMLFSITALFILILACINFTNLTTARSVSRTKEIGVRKVLGSSKKQLIIQFLTESVNLSFFALIFALAIVEIMVPSFNTLTGKEMTFGVFGNWETILILVLLIFLVGFMAGIYPSIFLSSHNPVAVLSGNVRKRMKNPIVRGILVLIQFFISITLVISTVEIYRQLNFINSTDVGFNRENILVVERAYTLGEAESVFKQVLNQNPNIKDVCLSYTIPGQGFNATSHRLEGRPEDELHLLHYFSVDNNFNSIMEIDLVEGRFFSSEIASDSNAIVLNECAIKSMGIEDPIGKTIILPTALIDSVNATLIDSILKYKIIGVVEDFNFESLHRDVRPLAIYQREFAEYAKYILIKMNSRDDDNTIDYVGNIWHEIFPDQTFSHFWLDEKLNEMYSNEAETGKIFLIFSVLALFLALLGLYGLTLFITLQRSKEIGIRKIMGATNSSIVYLLLKDFSKWIIMANIIAWPVAYYVIHQWSKNFTYSNEFNIWVYILSGLFILITALLAVILQTLRAAIENPVKALKYDE